MPVKAIMFDIDGTLVDSNEQHVTIWADILRGEGAVLDRRTIHDQIGKGADMLLPTLLPEADEAARERLAEAHGAMFRARFLTDVRPFPGARDLLVRAHAAGRKIVLASSASAAELDHYLDLLDVRAIVAATTSADDVGNTKPAPDIFATALEKLAPLRADEVIVVGDTPYDAEAAARCGIVTVAVRSGGFGDDALRGAGAAYLYDDVAALLAEGDRSPLMAADTAPSPCPR